MQSTLELVDPVKKQAGCFITRTVALVVVLTVVALVVAVGVAVYFTSHRQCLDAASDPERQWQRCQDMAKDKGCTLNCPATTSPATSDFTPSATTPKPTSTPKPTGLRLNRTILPIHYNVKLQPYIYDESKNFTFDGTVEILMNITEPTTEIIMHMSKITLNETTLIVKKGSKVQKHREIEEDEERHFLKIYFDSALAAGEDYYFRVEYTGTLKHSDLGGFYLSKYTENGKTIYLATTQFQRSDARRAFPCFDEPGIKATFNITLVRKLHFSSISNMEIIRNETRSDGWVEDVYNTTVRMPCYLLAFVVSDFEHRWNVTAKGTKFRLWARREYVNQLDHSLAVSGLILEAFENYTGVPYPLSKTDQIAVPDFAAGAMENWGLVTYRESLLLYNPLHSTMSQMRSITSVIGHELAHQWFGNLVTCDWWDDTFLNEGFATFMAPKGVDAVFPNWNMEPITQWKLQKMLVTDGKPWSQPVRLTWVEHHRETKKAFHTLTYNKGGSILRMMEYFLGDSFRKGVTKYLKRHAYQSVTIQDLYNALEEQVQEDNSATWRQGNLSSIMSTWLDQMGYPLVTVNKTGQNTYEISQKHFLYESNATSLSYSSPFGEYRWDIPFTYGTMAELQNKSFTGHIKWIPREETSQLIAQGPYQIANVLQQGFYRVNYDEQTWKEIIQQLNENHTVINVLSRAQLVDDTMNLVQAELMEEARAMNITEYLKNEQEYLPWWNALSGSRGNIPRMETLLYNTPAYRHFQKYMLNLITPKAYEYVGWDDSDPNEHLKKYLRQLIINRACDWGYRPCLDKARRLYQEWMDNKGNFTIISPNLRSTVYCQAMRAGGAAEWEFAHHMYQQNLTGYTASEKSRLWTALSCTEQPWLLNRLLEMGVATNSSVTLERIAKNPAGEIIIWDFLRQNWDKWPSAKLSKRNILNSLTTKFANEYQLQKVKSFAEKFPDMLVYPGIINRIESNIEWVKKNEKPLQEFFVSANSKSSQTLEEPDSVDEEALIEDSMESAFYEGLDSAYELEE